MDRSVLDTIDVPILEVTLERLDRLAYLSVSTERSDGSPGKITVWRTDDNVSLAMRNDVLIETRGLGGGLVSSSANVSGTTPGPSGSGERIQFFQSLDNKQVRIVQACDLVEIGRETIVIFEDAHATRHVRENCESSGGTVVNDYWVDSQAGLVWQSRQWAGPNIGYLKIRRLIK